MHDGFHLDVPNFNVFFFVQYQDNVKSATLYATDSLVSDAISQGNRPNPISQGIEI